MNRSNLSDANRVVVKLGTAVVSRPDGRLALGRIGAIVEGIAALRAEGREVLLVSSGAVGLGASRLGITPRDVVDQQACAAAGQGLLMGLYDTLFQRLGLSAAQVLLTDDDFDHRGRYVHLAATLERLLKLGAVPILNENDVVNVSQLKTSAVFGDNDSLAALVAANVGCDALVLLSNVDGVHTKPPGEPGSERISVWGEQEAELVGVSSAGRGGMEAKVRAARQASDAGVHTVIASGLGERVLERVVAGEDVGTLFPSVRGLTSRKRWVAFATAPRGSVEVNAGARAALVERHASLLAAGVVCVDGEFEAGAVIEVVCGGAVFARGMVREASGVIAGWSAAPERGQLVVHCDELVILEDG